MDIKSYALGFAMGKKKGGSGGGDIIDVPALPTENIEQDKIYRVVKDTDGSVEVYLATQPIDEWFENFYKQMAGMDMSVNVVYYIVDTVPENPKAADMAGSNATMYLYILASTGEPYLQGPAGTAITIPEMMGVGHYAGIVTSVDEMTDGMGIYTIMTESGSSTIYGIPDEANNKTVFEHTSAGGWAAVNTDIVDVPELPTENIEEGKIYRATKNTEESVVVWLARTQGGEKKVEPFGDFFLAQGGMPNGAQVHYGFIESLDQEPPKPNDETYMNTYIWVLRETGIPYMYFAGSYIDLGTALESDISICKGYIDDPHMAPEWNFVFYSVHTPAESSTTYGIPNAHPVKRFVDGAWVELVIAEP